MLYQRFAFNPRHTVPLISMLGVSLVLLSSDLYIPIMPSLAHAFGASSDMIQMTLSAQFLGTTLFSILAGPLSDYMGRRFVIMGCLIAFLVCAIGCALATDVYTLLIFRFLQGCGASGIMATSITLVKDVFLGIKGVQIIARLMMVSVTTPALGPILGGHIAAGFGWRAVFYTVVVLTLIITALNFLFLPETNPKVCDLPVQRDLRHFSLKKVIGNYKIIYSNTHFLKNALAHSSMFGGKWCFISVAPFVYIETLKIPKEIFGYYLAGLAIAFGIFQYFSKFIIKRFGQVRLMQLGLISGLAGSLLFLATAYLCPFSPLLLSIAVSFYFGAIAWVAPPAVALALAAFPTVRGTAASAVSNLRTLMGFIGATLGGIISDTGFVGVGIFLLATALIPFVLTINHKD